MGQWGLRWALEARFPNLTFILDRPHLTQHLYEGAEAIGLTGFERHHWVSDKLQRINSGGVREVIRILKSFHISTSMGVLYGQLAVYSPLKGKYLAVLQYSSPYVSAMWKKSI